MIRFLLKIAVSIGAIAGGLLAQRPLSIRWFLHWLWGNGREMRLPEKYERQLLWEFHDAPRLHCIQEGCREWDLLPHKAKELVCHSSTDLFTTVGAVAAWVEDGHLHYLDVYDWHPEESWAFRVSLPGLPFNVQVRGLDSIWVEKLALGTEFVTRGSIALTEDAVRAKRAGGYKPVKEILLQYVAKNDYVPQ